MKFDFINYKKKKNRLCSFTNLSLFLVQSICYGSTGFVWEYQKHSG